LYNEITRSMTSTKILIVDDEPQARRVLRAALVAQAFEVDDAATGEEAIEKLRKQSPDIILLDLKMPGMGGIQACREIRASTEVPVIVVSGKKSRQDRTEAYESGADGYLAKPFGIDELVACIRAVKRRVDFQHPRVLVIGDVEVDFETHEMKRKDGVVHLTAKEFKLLRCLATHPGEVVSHRRILQAVWGPEYGDEIEYLRVFIAQLRKKIEPDPHHPIYILTDAASGYRLVIPPRSRAAGEPASGEPNKP
jgi:two-component system, OmpR family, KDP operon response regulator KdpE